MDIVKDVKPKHQHKGTRLRRDKANKDSYYAETYVNLYAGDMSVIKNCDGKCNGKCNVHIESIYEQVVTGLDMAAVSTVPETTPEFL